MALSRCPQPPTYTCVVIAPSRSALPTPALPGPLAQLYPSPLNPAGVIHPLKNFSAGMVTWRTADKIPWTRTLPITGALLGQALLALPIVANAQLLAPPLPLLAPPGEGSSSCGPAAAMARSMELATGPVSSTRWLNMLLGLLSSVLGVSNSWTCQVGVTTQAARGLRVRWASRQQT